MRITSQMLAANQLKAGIEPSSKTLLDYIQNDDNDSLTSLLSKKIAEDVICDTLSISPLTLETHIRNIHKRMNINSRHELMYIGRPNNKNIIPYGDG